MAEHICSCSYLSDKDWENRIERIDKAARNCALCPAYAESTDSKTEKDIAAHLVNW